MTVTPQQAWLFGLATMLLVFLAVYWREGRLRQALVYSLLWGKVLASVFWVLGLDVPLAIVYTYAPEAGLVPRATITANMLVFLSFLWTNIIAAAWPELKRELRLR